MVISVTEGMSFRCLPESYMQSLNRAVYIWDKQGQRFVSLILCNPPGRLCIKRPLSYRGRDSHPAWRQRNRFWHLCRISLFRRKILLYSSLSSFNTSVSCGSTNLSHHMSRLKNTLEYVSKAVSGTQTEILSKISRFKSKPGQENAGKEASTETTPLQNQDETPALAATPTGALLPQPALSATSPQSLTTNLPETKSKKSLLSEKASTTASQAKSGEQPVLSDSSGNSKQSTPLFHPSSFTVNLDETYNYLAHHVNSYFSSPTLVQEQKKEQKHIDLPSPSESDQTCPNSNDLPTTESTKDQTSPATAASNLPSSPKKGFGQYLTYTPTVQAFVGNYIAPLVPRFRTEPKTALVETEKTLRPDNSDLKSKETPEVKEQKAAEEKAKRLLLQREKIIARVSVDNRTRALVQALRRASDVRLYISRVEELSYHLLEFPETRLVAVKEKVIPCLLRLRQAHDPSLKAAIREALTLVGYVEPVKSKGIRILSIDGGGTRGLVALQTLQKLEELSGKRIYQLFDYICGVSTGAILGFMLGVYHIPLSECEELYRKLGSDVFKQNVIVGTVKMGWRHAFYDSEIWENVLKERMGSDLLIETSRNPDCPRVAAVSTVVNKGTPLKAHVFRNYNLPVGVRSHYRGSCKHKLWEAIRASSAAPGYFQEFTLGSDLHQDGGLLINNPTALAIHECQCLWPSTPLQCVVSLGTGRFETPSKNSATYTSLKTKLTNVISSATDTEEVHTMLDALLPPHTYFRFNPYMSEEVALDESRREKLNQLQAEGARYLERNEDKLKRVVIRLTQEKGSAQRLLEWLRLKSHMYSDLPPISKM